MNGIRIGLPYMRIGIHHIDGRAWRGAIKLNTYLHTVAQRKKP